MVMVIGGGQGIIHLRGRPMFRSGWSRFIIIIIDNLFPSTAGYKRINFFVLAAYTTHVLFIAILCHLVVFLSFIAFIKNLILLLTVPQWNAFWSQNL